MSRKKKHTNVSGTTSEKPDAAVPRSPLPSAEEFSRRITFDSLEDQIRGEDMLRRQEDSKLKEEREIKKKLEQGEVDRRMEELRQKLGIKKSKR